MGIKIPNNETKEGTRFWNFKYAMNSEEDCLHINGFIAENSWFDDDISPKEFKSELDNCTGNIKVWINSPGGDVFAASQIYTMLKQYNGKVTVLIDGVAASAASVIAMAGSSIEMSPSALMMVHNPATQIFGEVADLEQGIEMLNEVKEAIINAYQQKTGLQRAKLGKLMDSETWMNARKAVELGFADKVLYDEEHEEDDADFIFNKNTFASITASAMRKKLPVKLKTAVDELPKNIKLNNIEPEKPEGADYKILQTRLNLIK